MYLVHVLSLVLVLLYSGTQCDAATSFSPASETATSLGADLVIDMTIVVSADQTATLTYGLSAPVKFADVAVDADGDTVTTLTVPSTLDSRYTVTKTSDTVLQITIKNIAQTDDGIILTFDSTVNGEDATFTVETKLGFSPLAAPTFAQLGSDFTITLLVPTDQSQTYTCVHDLLTGTDPTMGQIVVDHDATSEAEKVVVTADSSLDAAKYSIVEATDTTATLVVKGITVADDASKITCTSTVAAQNVEFLIKIRTSFGPVSTTAGTLGSDFVITITFSVALDDTITVVLFDDDLTNIAVASVVIDTSLAAASKLALTADSNLVSTEYVVSKATDTTVTITVKTFAVTDFYSGIFFDSTIAGQDALYVIGGASTLTFGFSMLLALAVALREFMSA